MSSQHLASNRILGLYEALIKRLEAIQTKAENDQWEDTPGDSDALAEILHALSVLESTNTLSEAEKKTKRDLIERMQPMLGALQLTAESAHTTLQSSIRQNARETKLVQAYKP